MVLGEEMKKKIVAVIMLVVMVFNTCFVSNGSVYAFELREGDTIEDDEDYQDVEFGETDVDEDDDETSEDEMDYDEALDLLEDNNIDEMLYKVGLPSTTISNESTLK